ncbi:MAG: hypothetical protein MUF55_11025 [Hydrogenophaga sp.]|jgi:hypothetical protein|nr:hypothetical protein [Hydrogenophaga sp.]
MNRYGSRKFIVALLALGSAHWLVATAVISGDVYQAVVIATVGAYIVGNVAQKAVEKGLGK